MHSNGEASYEVDWAGSGRGSGRGSGISHVCNGDAGRVILVVDFSQFDLRGIEVFGFAGEEIELCEDWRNPCWGRNFARRRDISKISKSKDSFLTHTLTDSVILISPALVFGKNSIYKLTLQCEGGMGQAVSRKMRHKMQMPRLRGKLSLPAMLESFFCTHNFAWSP